MVSVKSSILTFRKFGVREILGALCAPGLVGYPSSMNTDASPVYRCMAYRNSELAFASCDVSGSVLGRSVGQTSKWRSGNRKHLSKKAKLGFRPCYAAVTHVALPPAIALGDGEAIKAQRPYPRKGFGPWGGRRVVARRYNQACGYLPDAWDRAAFSLLMDAPNPPQRAPVHASRSNSAIPQAKNKPPPPCFDT